MDKLNVLVLFPLKDKYVDQIREVDSRIKVREAGSLVEAELGLSMEWRAPWVWDMTLKSDVSAEQASRELDILLSEAEVLYASALPPNLFSRAPRLKWIQAIGAGIDNFLGTGVLESSLIVTTTKGIQAITIAEWVLGSMFMLAKQGPRLFADKQQRRWQRYIPMELYGQTLAVVGLGNIGRQLAQLAKALGMRVLATRRSATRREISLETVDIMYPVGELRIMLAQSDFVVICLPLTLETARIIGEAELRAMKPTSYLINISRGGVVDETVLIRALKEGWIAGAGLDVFEKEPLPKDSELWELRNVILSPHMAGSTPLYNDRATRLFCDNLRRCLSGQPLINVVDKKAAY